MAILNVRDLKNALGTGTALKELIDLLVEEGLVKRVCKKHAILDEEWRIEPVFGDDRILDANNKTVMVANWRQELAALPDCLRALVMVDNHLEHNRDYSPEQCMSIFITPAVYSAIAEALKKAGVS